MTTKINMHNILNNEYGIETIEEVMALTSVPTKQKLSLAKRIAHRERAKTSKKLISNSKIQENQDFNDRVFKESRELVYANKTTRLLEECDYNTRYEYAWAVARSLEWTGTYEDNYLHKKVFVALRMAKLWDWTEVAEVEDLLGVILRHVNNEVLYLGNEGAWDWAIGYIVTLCKVGMSLQQINRFMGLVGGLRETNVCISTATMQYSGGFHFGDWLFNATNGVRRKHVNLFNTFMRVYKHTHKISPKLSGRYLKVFEGMDDKTLRLTSTDSRNWSINNYGNYRFRMNVVVKDVNNWQPLRLNHMRDKMWLEEFGRKPINRNIYMLPKELVMGFTKKSFGFFVKEAKRLEFLEDHNNHSLLALARLIVWFGKDYISYIDMCDTHIHDAGINLPNKPFQDGVKFLRRYVHKMHEAQRVLPNWQYCMDNGVNPIGKDGLSKANALCKSLIYEGIEDIDFAKECAKWSVSQYNFGIWQGIWKNRNIKYESIPKIIVTNCDWKFYRLGRDDPRGLFLGEYTGCCQHPNGQGSSCAWDGAMNSNSAFVVLEYRGEVKFQSWVWRSKDTLVFDNIEGGCKADLLEDAKKTYLKGINAFSGIFGVKNLLVGTGNSDIKLDFQKKQNPLGDSPASYSDAKYVWEVTNEQG